MKDLIKEIEGLKLETHPEETEYRFGFRDGNNACVVSVKNILNQHNLITAPKSIKLSEVVSKLNDNEWKDFQITKQENLISIDNNNNFREYLNIDKGKITDISEEMQTDKYKWLYSLWIAGTEIIDDLKEEEK